MFQLRGFAWRLECVAWLKPITTIVLPKSKRFWLVSIDLTRGICLQNMVNWNSSTVSNLDPVDYLWVNLLDMAIYMINLSVSGFSMARTKLLLCYYHLYKFNNTYLVCSFHDLKFLSLNSCSKCLRNWEVQSLIWNLTLSTIYLVFSIVT